MKVIKVKCSSALNPSKLPEFRYCVNPYIGCEHGCKYCYVPSLINDKEVTSKWGETVKVKVNLPNVLLNETKRKRVGLVGVGTSTDPYQPVEATFKLTRRTLEILNSRGFPASIQTKSNLILRDVDLISSSKSFDVGVTITTLNGDLASSLEPKASTPGARAQVLDEFSSRNVKTWLFYGPIIPGLNDDEETMNSVVKLAKKTRSLLIYDKLRLRRGVLESLNLFLEEWNPTLKNRLLALASPNSPVWREIFSRLEFKCREAGVRVEASFHPQKNSIDKYITWKAA